MNPAVRRSAKPGIFAELWVFEDGAEDPDEPLSVEPMDQAEAKQLLRELEGLFSWDSGLARTGGSISDTASRVIALSAEWQGQFLRKNAEYGDDSEETGILGQVFDLIRKTNKIKRALWKRDLALTTESPREVLMDIIGHCFLAIDMLDRVEVVDPDGE